MNSVYNPPRRLHAPTCGYCNVEAVLSYGAYGRRWECPMTGCDARVGIHKDSPSATPLGTMARGPLRVLRMRVHLAFDPLWRSDNAVLSRSLAYGWLAKEMGITEAECHVAKMDEATCELALAVLEHIRPPSAVCPCRGCDTPIDDRFLVCEYHFRRIPEATKHRLVGAHFAGLRVDQQSEAYVDLALQAIAELNGGGL